MKDDERTRANGILTLVENELLKQIREVYDDVTTTAQAKKTEREIYTEQFIRECAKKLELPEDKVRSIVELMIAKTRWIKEIEELDEEIEDNIKIEER